MIEKIKRDLAEVVEVMERENVSDYEGVTRCQDGYRGQLRGMKSAYEDMLRYSEENPAPCNCGATQDVLKRVYSLINDSHGLSLNENRYVLLRNIDAIVDEHIRTVRGDINKALDNHRFWRWE